MTHTQQAKKMIEEDRDQCPECNVPLKPLLKAYPEYKYEVVEGYYCEKCGKYTKQ